MINSISDFKEIIIGTALSNIAGCLSFISDIKNNGDLTDKGKTEYIEIKNMEISYRLESLFEYFKNTSSIMHFDGQNVEPFIDKSVRNQDNSEEKRLIFQAGQIIKQRIRYGKPKLTNRQKIFNVIYNINSNNSLIKNNRSHFEELQSYTFQQWLKLYRPGKTLKDFVINHIEEKLRAPDHATSVSAEPSTIHQRLTNMLVTFRGCADAEFEELFKNNDFDDMLFKEIDKKLSCFKQRHTEVTLVNLGEYSTEKKKILMDNRRFLRKNRDEAGQILSYFEDSRDDVKVILEYRTPLEKIKSFIMQKRGYNR